MTVDDIRTKIVRKGSCLYAGVRKYAVYLCKEDILYGTGDYEDAPGIADDQDMECYTVYFGDLLDDNTIRASAGQYKSFERAVEAAESSEGFQNWEIAMDNHVGCISYSDREEIKMPESLDQISCTHRASGIDGTQIIKKDAVKLVRKRLKELLKPLGFQPHPKEKNRFMRVREELIDEVSLRTDGTNLKPCFHMYYRKAPFVSIYVDLVNGSLYRVIKERENISRILWWDVNIPDSGPYYYQTEHFEEIWKNVVIALECYILPYMDAMSVEKLLSFMVKRYNRLGEEGIFRVKSSVFFSDKYFACMEQAAVYGVGMWIAENYEEGLPYIIFAQNKYRERIRPHEQEKEKFREGRILGVLDTLIDIYERRPQELKATVQRLTDMISADWVDYVMDFRFM